MSVQLGMDCVLYRNSGNYSSPVWNECANVRDNTLNMETAKADVTTRGNNGWRANAPTLKEGSIEFEALWDLTDANFAAMFTAFLNNTPLDMLVLDQAIASGSAQGLRAVMMVTKCSRKEPLEDATKADVMIEPTYASNPPRWVSAAANGTLTVVA